MSAASSIATEMDLEQLTELFRLLSDKTRLNILLLLASGERNVSWLCGELKLPQPTVSHHLGLLRLHKILANRRAGKQIFYQLNGRVDQPTSDGLSIHTEHYIVRIASAGPARGVSITESAGADRAAGLGVDRSADHVAAFSETAAAPSPV